MKVDYFSIQADMQTALMGSLGLSTDYIAAKTGLTISQVQYRLAKASIRRADYRNGNCSLVPSLLGSRLITGMAKQEIQSRLEKAMNLDVNPRKRRTG